MKIVIIDINKLKFHEHILESRVLQLMKMIKKKGKFIKPIVVEKNAKIILDGHHRVEAMKRMGFKKIPAQLVDYKNIKVELRHKNLPDFIIRGLVELIVKKNKLLPRKTTKHCYQVKNKSFAFSVLQ